MDRPDSRALALPIFAMLLTPGSAFAFDWSLAVQNRFFLQTLPEEVLGAQLRYPTLTSTSAGTNAAYQLHALGSISGRPIDELGLRLGIDTGLIEIGRDGALIDGRDPADAFERTGFLGETLLDLQLGEGSVVRIQIGKLRPRIGRSAIFDAYAFGATLDANGTLLHQPVPVSARFGAFLPDATFTAGGKDSPLFDVEVAYHFDQRTQIRVIGAFFIDGDRYSSPILDDALVRGRVREIAQAGEELVQTLPPSDQEAARQRLLESEEQIALAVDEGNAGYDISTRGWLGWSGIEAELGLGDLELGGVLLVGFGAIDSSVAPDRAFERKLRAQLDTFPRLADAVLERQSVDREVELLAYYLGVDARYALTENLSIELFGIAMSGDDGVRSPVTDPDPDRGHHGFVSIAPFIPKTGIFFGGAVAPLHSTPVIASFAPDGAGLLAGGIDVEWFVSRELRLRALVASMASSVTRDIYGVEVGASFDALLLDWLVASAGGSVFIPGRHFGSDLPVGGQAIAALRVLFQD